MFVRATAADPKHPALWANLASSLKALGRRTEEMDAIRRRSSSSRAICRRCCRRAPTEDTGDPREAARVYQNALACIPPGDRSAAQHQARRSIKRKQLVDADLAALTAALEEPLAEIRERHGGRASAASICASRP